MLEKHNFTPKSEIHLMSQTTITLSVLPCDVLDEFFEQANEFAAESGTDLKKQKEALKVYKDRRKTEKDDGVANGLNNW